jgi:hypothetical protein
MYDSRTFSKMFLSTFCSKSFHAADNILMSWELLAWYSTLHHVSNTLMIINLLKSTRSTEQGLHKFSKNREPPQNYKSQKGNMKQDTWGRPINFRSPCTRSNCHGDLVHLYSRIYQRTFNF